MKSGLSRLFQKFSLEMLVKFINRAFAGTSSNVAIELTNCLLTAIYYCAIIGPVSNPVGEQAPNPDGEEYDSHAIYSDKVAPPVL